MKAGVQPDTRTEEEEEDLTSRSDIRRARRTREDALAQLAKEITELSKRNLERLGLPESVLEAVYEARAITSLRARGRQLRVVRGTLRAADWPAIRVRLDAMLLHGTVPAAPADPASPVGRERQWVVRLLGEGPKALDALIEEYPKADRKHLRQLIRNVERSPTERRKRAEEKLATTLRFLIERG